MRVVFFWSDCWILFIFIFCIALVKLLGYAALYTFFFSSFFLL